VAPEAKLEFPPGGSNGSHTWFNLNYKPLSDLRVRKAIALVFDQEKLAIGGFGSTQFRNIQYGLFAPGYSIPPEEAQKILGWDKPWADRTAEARKLMAEAGYADGFKLQLVVQSTPEKEKYVTILADILRRELKIDTEIVVRIDAEAQKLRDAKQYGTYAQGMLALVGDPDEVVGYFRTGNPANFTGYSNPELDKLIDQQSTEMDVAKRKQLVNQMERLIWKDIPALPEGLNRLGSNYWPYVKNFIVHDASYSSNVMMEQTWLQK
jgi:ABC-type transport system substrate-binding protein